MTHCKTFSSVRVDRENLSRILRNCGCNYVLVCWGTGKTVKTSLSCALNCLQSLETDVKGESTTSASYVFSIDHIAQVKHNPDHKLATFFLSLFVLMATLKTCQRKLVNSFSPADKTCQGKTRQRKFVVHTHKHMNIVNDTCEGKLARV